MKSSLIHRSHITSISFISDLFRRRFAELRVELVSSKGWLMVGDVNGDGAENDGVALAG